MKIINNLFVGAIAFVVLISIALITISPPDLPYELSQEETLETVVQTSEDEITPEEIQGLSENTSENIYFIDLRSPGEFVKGHIGDAMNIPQSSILQEEKLEFFRSLDSDQTVVLYGVDQIQANGPWMILKQLGVDNVKMLKGGYEYYATHASGLAEQSETPAYQIEVPLYDYNEVMAQTPGIGDVATETDGPREIVPVRRERTQSVVGGC